MSEEEHAPEQVRANKEAAGDASSDVIRFDEIKPRIGELMTLYEAKQDASGKYKDAAELVARKGGVDPKVLKAYIKACYDDKMSQAHAGAEQLSLLFENIDSSPAPATPPPGESAEP